ncbi:MAG: DoxX family protein [Massilia sp.]|jgi:putative oxidoreductase|nr:DoxX family protein [Massilia sp.]
MIKSLQSPLSLSARLAFALLFLPAGIGKLTGFAGTVGYITSVGMPLPQLAAALALILEIGGGLALLLGFGTRIAAIALALFTLVASFYFHNYWAAPEAQAFVQQLMFYKNIAVVGGLLSVAAWGAGAWSVDGMRKAVN